MPSPVLLTCAGAYIGPKDPGGDPTECELNKPQSESTGTRAGLGGGSSVPVK